MTLEFKRIHPDAVLPGYAKPGDAGMDLRSVDELSVPPRGRAGQQSPLRGFRFGRSKTFSRKYLKSW